tara:strand:- start:467 stop:709 length:243 start_codon:yes stop_codon:yes gene_type:complete
MSKEWDVRIQSTVSYDFMVEIEADTEEDAIAFADEKYWQDEYHTEARNSQLHDEFEVVSATEIVQEDDSMDDDDDFPGRE